ncbi:C3 protein [Sida yellow vein Madurai virus]|uniref:Replication enhancer protein n=1 Tax=Sida yellow vein Madurai virus TaxID=420255 RepID=Q17ZR0_9GEMI|nr:C3 protein [Sida yellow vein Madurai virus]CAJ90737.1 C3 protein [Sida yellow vein Madurai virus]
MDSRTGEYITAAQATRAIYWDMAIPLYFKILDPPGQAVQPQPRHHYSPTQVNHNLRKALGVHKCFITFRIWTRLHPQTMAFLEGLTQSSSWVLRQIRSYLHKQCNYGFRSCTVGCNSGHNSSATNSVNKIQTLLILIADRIVEITSTFKSRIHWVRGMSTCHVQ